MFLFLICIFLLQKKCEIDLLFFSGLLSCRRKKHIPSPGARRFSSENAIDCESLRQFESIIFKFAGGGRSTCLLSKIMVDVICRVSVGWFSLTVLFVSSVSFFFFFFFFASHRSSYRRHQLLLLDSIILAWLLLLLFFHRSCVLIILILFIHLYIKFTCQWLKKSTGDKFHVYTTTLSASIQFSIVFVCAMKTQGSSRSTAWCSTCHTISMNACH